MSLLDLSNEILLQIFSYGCLRRSDLHNTILTCHRLYEIGLPFLYRQVCISARPNHVIPGKLITNVDRFFKISVLYPAHLSFIRTAELYWENDCPGRTNRLFDLLSRFSSVRTVTIKYAYPGSSTRQLLRHAAAFKRPTTLRHVKLIASQSSYASISAQDIATLFFSLPNIETFTLENFDPENFEGEDFTYPSTNLTRLEFLKSTALPRGSLMTSLLMCHPALRTLIWTVQTKDTVLVWTSLSVDQTLSPLKPHLTDLRLTLKTCPSLHNHRIRKIGDQLDFSGFAVLKNLEFHEQFTFAQAEVSTRPRDAGWPKYIRADLYRRLPASLETLTIHFDPCSYILKNWTTEKTEDYAWILTLAAHKSTNLQRLRRVSLIERIQWEHRDPDVYPPRVQRVKAREWEYPLEVLKVFREAGIALTVMLRPPPSPQLNRLQILDSPFDFA
ncbi:hypothetical protein BKA64DRAFT_61965 [Cadophora sp. MPI-SDFR-AT-0126]|nr:hypothetical protein BKA64DRAFT_61965 [Leotiomycetes sp. MPI-SDFR-AT-0126]